MTLDHAEAIDSATIVEHIIGDGNFYSEFDKEVGKFSQIDFFFAIVRSDPKGMSTILKIFENKNAFQ